MFWQQIPSTAAHAKKELLPPSFPPPPSSLPPPLCTTLPPTHHASVPRVSVTREASSGLHHASQRRGVTPLVLFWNLLGKSL